MTRVRSHSFRHALVRWGLWLGCTIGVAWLNFHPTTTPLDDDELYWIGSAYYFNLAWVRGDWAHPDWQLLPARENPPLAKYVIGASLAARGQHIESMDMLGLFYLHFKYLIPGAWGTGSDYAKRAAVAARVQPALREQLRPGVQLTLQAQVLQPARWVMLACAVATSGLLFLLGAQMGGWAVGLLASQLLLLHPAVVAAYNHALSDAVAMLFSVAAAGVVMKFASRAEESRAWGWPTALGLAAGVGALLALACAAKMNSLVVVVLFVGAALLAVMRRGRVGGRREIGAVLLTTAGALGLAVILFVAINPAILADVRGGLVACVREHQIAESIQARFLAGHLSGGMEKLSAVTNLLGAGRWGLGLLGVAALGILFTPVPSGRVVGGWWWIAACAITAWIPFERSRYVLPLIPPSMLVLGWLLGVTLPRGVRSVWQQASRRLARQ